jgi:hypothetical protein
MQRTEAVAATPRIEIGAIVDTVDCSLEHAVPRDEIEGLLRELLAERFGDARVLSYLPILLHRAACESLRDRRLAAH